ncbi:MAG: hypothetical protein H7647_06090 [Candidatus Heimdallarchaeota archaeon]|nr:hypothetical protein [Candidatus Heimdallarchaeota archaeon]MCK4253996.1 hypothetical protein [Candidatus Heimdallarchaeota archaeon]
MTFIDKYHKFLEKYKIIVIVTIPISIQVFRFQRSIDFNQILPRGGDSREAYIATQEDLYSDRINV